VRAYRQTDLARLIGYVPQSEGRRWPFPVREFVLMGRYPYLSPFTPVSREDRSVVDEVLELTETAVLADRRMDTLSGGERQRVLVAAALAQRARLLLLDEPATFLDPPHQAHVLRVLQRVNREQGVTVVAVTHDINTAVLTSRSVVALKDGEVVHHGPPASVMDEKVLERVYGMRFQFTVHPVSGQRMVVPEVTA
jgi:iron complex transport system ATP-binding protein